MHKQEKKERKNESKKYFLTNGFIMVVHGKC